MEDFCDATAITREGPNKWTAEIRKDWALWGPSGGFLSALAMRAVGEATDFVRPISFACQFLSRAKFASADIIVQSLRKGNRTEALRAEIIQDGKLILTSQVWVGMPTGQGMQHDFSGCAGLPDPMSLPTYEDSYPDEPVHPFMRRLGQRPINPLPHKDDTPISEPEISGFHKFEPTHRHENAFVDAARIFLLVDTFAWLATYPAHPTSGPSPWIAPNLDFYYRFHRPSVERDWLYLKTRAALAESGLIAAEGEVRSRDGNLIATGVSQLICFPRPVK